MSRTAILTILSAVAAMILDSSAVADPLLTKAQIAKAAAKIEACLDKQRNESNPSSCMGLVKGPCDDAITAGGEAAHATCSDTETAAWDVLLNKRWTELSSSMTPEKFTALKAVQKLWLAYRDAKCAFLATDDPSMMGYMNAAECRLEETSGRVLELRDLGGG